jgi:hypothetical protein
MRNRPGWTAGCTGWNGGCDVADHRLADDQLPDANGNVPTVTLTLEQLRRFRDSYGWLQDFAADVCGTTPERLCIWDVDKWRYQHGLTPRDPLMRHFAQEADQRRLEQGAAPLLTGEVDPPRQDPPRGPAEGRSWRERWARVLAALARLGHPW